MKAWLGVTDWDWYAHLRTIGATEVNFWQPTGVRRFSAIEPGAPFLFKSHYSRRNPTSNRIIGAGFLSGWARLPLSTAWDFFSEANGCATLKEMRQRIGKYRRLEVSPAEDPEIGCIMLRDVRFFAPEKAPPAPDTWSANIVQGRTYEFDTPEGSYLESVLVALSSRPSHSLSASTRADLSWAEVAVPGPVFEGTRQVPVRVGQRAFKALVQEAYGRKCAVTGDRIVPVLEAAHIRPVTQQGENRIDNGLLLRSDVHTLFDRGYLAIHPERRTLLVSPRLRSQWGNGEEFYARAATQASITEPNRKQDRPSREFLMWHADSVFLAS